MTADTGGWFFGGHSPTGAGPRPFRPHAHTPYRRLNASAPTRSRKDRSPSDSPSLTAQS